MKRYTRNCQRCGIEFVTNLPNKRFCKNDCRLKELKFERNKQNRNLDLPPGSVGAVSELIVAIDLMKKGFDVYRAMSPHGFADLIALKDGVMIQIEVRTGIKLKNDQVGYPKFNIHNKSVAIVTYPENRIHYITNPELGELPFREKTDNEPGSKSHN